MSGVGAGAQRCLASNARGVRYSDAPRKSCPGSPTAEARRPGRRQCAFESRSGYEGPVSFSGQSVRLSSGGSPVRVRYGARTDKGTQALMAQRKAHLITNQGVAGSNPARGTFGTGRSLVAHRFGGPGFAGPNPASPTMEEPADRRRRPRSRKPLGHLPVGVRPASPPPTDAQHFGRSRPTGRAPDSYSGLTGFETWGRHCGEEHRLCSTAS